MKHLLAVVVVVVAVATVAYVLRGDPEKRTRRAAIATALGFAGVGAVALSTRLRGRPSLAPRVEANAAVAEAVTTTMT